MKNRKMVIRKYSAGNSLFASVWQAGTVDPSKYSTYLNSAMLRTGLEMKWCFSLDLCYVAGTDFLILS